MGARMPKRSRSDRAPDAPAGLRAAWPTPAILVLGAALVFWLPWRVPVRTGIESDSSAFGFSNRAAIAGVGLTLLALLLTRLAEPDPVPWLRGLIRPPARATTVERAGLLAAIAAAAAVIWGWWGFLPHAYVGEVTYFLTRLDMMTLGFRPYRDFDYGYGPALLLVPAALHRGSGGLVAIDAAYVFTVIAHEALGLMAAAAILRRLAADPRIRLAALAFVLLASLNITLGVICSSLRFVYAAWAALVFHEAQRLHRPWVGWLAAFLLPFDGFMISPEVGVATVAALLAGLAWAAMRGRVALAPRACATVAAPAAVAALFGAESFGLLATFGSGALNFPVLPAPYVLALLGVAAFLLPALGAAALRHHDDLAPATVSLVTALGMMLPPALGRCDPGHALLNGLALVTVAVAVAWSRGGRRPRVAVAAAAVVMLVTAHLSTFSHYAGAVGHAVRERAASPAALAADARGDAEVLRAIGGGRRDFGWAKRGPFGADLVELLRFDALATPAEVMEDVDRFLKMSGRHVPLRHVPPFSGVVDRATAGRSAADALACDHILLGPDRPVSAADPGVFGRDRCRFLTGLLLFPVSLPVVNEPFVGEVEVRRRIAAEFVPVATFRGGVIYGRHGARGPAPAAARGLGSASDGRGVDVH